MGDRPETHAEIIAEMRKYKDLVINGKKYPDRLEAAHKREITILRDALAEVVESIEVRFPVIEYALDRKPYLDAKKILEQYKEEAALATTSSQTTQENNQ